MNKQIGCLWLKESKDGNQFMSGVIETLNGDVNIVVFPNNRKEKPNQPDYQILRSEPRSQGTPRANELDPRDGSEVQPPIESIPF